MKWYNLYGSVLLGMGDTIYARDERKFMKTACPTSGMWFGKFMGGSKWRKRMINNQDCGLTSKTVKYLLMG